MIGLIIPPSFIDATDWEIKIWENSGGTRQKRILSDSNGQRWYFKLSEKKKLEDKITKHYKYNFGQK